jgi:hypothetical protein
MSSVGSLGPGILYRLDQLYQKHQAAQNVASTLRAFHPAQTCHSTAKQSQIQRSDVFSELGVQEFLKNTYDCVPGALVRNYKGHQTSPYHRRGAGEHGMYLFSIPF